MSEVAGAKSEPEANLRPGDRVFWPDTTDVGTVVLYEQGAVVRWDVCESDDGEVEEDRVDLSTGQLLDFGGFGAVYVKVSVPCCSAECADRARDLGALPREQDIGCETCDVCGCAPNRARPIERICDEHSLSEDGGSVQGGGR